MNDEQLLRIQEEIMSSIESEINVENVIKNTAREVGARLSLQDKVTFEFMNVPYMAKCQQTLLHGGKRGIVMLVADLTNYSQFKEKYQPYTVTVEVDNKFSYRENLQAVMEAFFRHKTGFTQIDEIS